MLARARSAQSLSMSAHAQLATLRRAWPLLGTIVEVQATAQGTGAQLETAVRAAFFAIDRVQKLMSYHDAQSDVSRLNREAAQRPVTIDAQTWQVLSFCLDLFERSKGAFDPTVAPLLTRWGYLPNNYAPFPRPSRTSSAEELELLPNNLVRFRRFLRLDLGGVAKGFAVDRAIAALRAHGAESGCVNAGGDLRVFGPASREVWVRDPAQPGRLLALPPLADEALATSAAYFSAKIWRGQRVCPLVDARTRTSASTHQSISVRAPSCMVADALTKVIATATSGLAPLLSHYGAEALVLSESRKFRHAA